MEPWNDGDYRLLKQARRDTAEAMYDTARDRALSHGFVLRRNSATHYSLGAGRDGRFIWLWNLYPGKCRIVASYHHPRTPRLPAPKGWSLADAVEAAIRLRAERIRQHEAEGAIGQ